MKKLKLDGEKAMINQRPRKLKKVKTTANTLRDLKIKVQNELRRKPMDQFSKEFSSPKYGMTDELGKFNGSK